MELKFIKVKPMDVKNYDSESALILGLIDGWCEFNRKRKHKESDGNYWSGYLTTDMISEQTGLTVRTVQRKVLQLKTQGIILVGQFGKVSYDKRRWYMRSKLNDNLSSGNDIMSSPNDKVVHTITNTSNNISTKTSVNKENNIYTGAMEIEIKKLRNEISTYGKDVIDAAKRILEKGKPSQKEKLQRYNAILQLKEEDPQLFN